MDGANARDAGSIPNYKPVLVYMMTGGTVSRINQIRRGPIAPGITPVAGFPAVDALGRREATATIRIIPR
jgi:hypothetical protein